MKTCTKCEKNKRLSGFHKKKASIDGHNHICKICVRIKNQKDNAKKSLTTAEKIEFRAFLLTAKEISTLPECQVSLSKLRKNLAAGLDIEDAILKLTKAQLSELHTKKAMDKKRANNKTFNARSTEAMIKIMSVPVNTNKCRYANAANNLKREATIGGFFHNE
jgi:hypothetical protein